MSDSIDSPAKSDPRVGLCLTCVHGRAITHPHGGDPYWRCGLSDADKRFPKYPRLPVLHCIGYVPKP
ncbi:MAG: hypothetical protein AMXMBFR82_34630 [Candidatus Hydrogenedentota bacterium]